jgi:carbon monoxide dehydrogenase subunit G
MTKLGKFGNILIGVGTAGIALGKQLVETGEQAYSGWQEQAKAGASFGGSMIEYTKAVGASKLGFEGFNTVVRNNAEALSVLGGTVNAGAERFARTMAVMGDFTRGMNQGVHAGRSYIEVTRMLGLSTSDTADLMADMNSQTALATNLRKLDDTGQANATANYINQMSQLSMLTGKSIKEQSAQRKKLAADAQFQAAIYKMPLEQQTAMMKAYEEAVATGGPQAGELFKAGVTGSFKGVSAEAKQMASTEMGQAYLELGQTTKAAGVNAADVFKESLPGLKAAIENTRDTFADAAAAGLPAALNLFTESFSKSVKLEAIQEAADKIAQETGQAGGDIARALELVYKDIHGVRTKLGPDGQQVVTGQGDQATLGAVNVDVIKEELTNGLVLAGIDQLESTFDGIATSMNSLAKRLGIGVTAGTGTDAKKYENLSMEELNATNRLIAEGINDVGNFFKTMTGIFTGETSGAKLQAAMDVGFANLETQYKTRVATVKEKTIGSDEFKLQEQAKMASGLASNERPGLAIEKMAEGNKITGDKANNIAEKQLAELAKIAENTDRKKQISGPEVVIQQQVAKNARQPMGSYNEQENGNG